MQETKKTLKHSAFIAVLWILILAIVGTTSTYAWFSFTASTNVEPMSGTVSGGSADLRISATKDGEYGIYLELNPTMPSNSSGSGQSGSSSSDPDAAQFYTYLYGYIDGNYYMAAGVNGDEARIDIYADNSVAGYADVTKNADGTVTIKCYSSDGTFLRTIVRTISDNPLGGVIANLDDSHYDADGNLIERVVVSGATDGGHYHVDVYDASGNKVYDKTHAERDSGKDGGGDEDDIGQNVSGGLIPISTVNLNHWYAGTYQDKNHITRLYKEVDPSAYLIKGELYLKSLSKGCDVYLSKADTYFGSDKQALSALRLGIRVTTSAGTTTHIFKLDDMIDSSLSSKMEQTVTITSPGSVVSGLADSSGNPTWNNDPAISISNCFAVDNGNDSYSAGKVSLGQLPVNEAVKVDYWVYLEGCDENCINSVQAKDVAVQFGFVSIG